MRLAGRLICTLHECGVPLLLIGVCVSSVFGATGPSKAAICVIAVQLVRLAGADCADSVQKTRVNSPYPVPYSVATCDLSLRALGSSVSRHAYRGKTVWVVGASQGLGERVALDLASMGARVIASARRADALAAVAAKCSARGAAGTHVVTLDLQDNASIAAACKAVTQLAGEHGGLAYLYLLAGGTQRSAAEDTQSDVDLTMMQLNALSLMTLVKSALPALRQGSGRTRGRVVVVSSAAGKLPSPGQAGYAASKHALNGFFSSLRSELSDDGVGVTLVCPGPVATGAPGQPRITFGATLRESALGGAADNVRGAAAAAGTQEKARLSMDAASKWMLAAGAHGVREAWVARHPILLLLYIAQYSPLLAGAIIDAKGPGRVQAARAGGDMYK